MSDPTVVPCSGWEEKLAVLHSGDLSLAEREAFKRHIASCEACATVLNDYLEMDDLIRSSLTADHSLELHKDLLPVQSAQSCNPRSSLDLADRGGNSHVQLSVSIPSDPCSMYAGIAPTVAEDPDACYIIRISALCWTKYTEMFPNKQESEEVIVEISVGQALYSLFEEVTTESVSLHFDSPESSTKHPLCSIQIAAQCSLPLETRAPKAMELTIEDTVGALLLELFGVAIVDEVTVGYSSKGNVADCPLILAVDMF